MVSRQLLAENAYEVPDAPLPRARAAPGKTSMTSRLAPRPQQVVFRVESAEAAAVFADRFGPRDGNGVAAGAGEVVAQAGASTGAPLPPGVRERFEGSLGADLSAVRVHTGPASAEAAGAVGARAYTTGDDIHFGAGQYAPEDPFGLHLLAHEVAHTVQQSGGPATTQFKLAVSSPGDAAELEADRAADAMMTGAPALGITSVATGAMRSPLPGAGGAKPPAVSSGGFAVSKKFPLGKTKLSVFELEGEGTIAAEFKPKGVGGDDKGGATGTSPIEIKGDTAAGGDSAKLAAEKELELGWSFKPKLVGELEVGKDGIKGKVGVTAERKGLDLGALELGANEWSIDLASWDGKDGFRLATAGWKCSAKIAAGSMKVHGKDHDVTGTLSVELKMHPCWEEIARLIAQRIATMSAAQLAGAAGAAGLPIAVFLGGLVMWAKAGHEFDAVSAKIEGTASACRAAAAEALSGEHAAVILGGIDLAAGVGDLAKDIRAKVAAELKVPEGALAQVAKAKPNLPNLIYAAAWKQKWPPLKAALLAQWQDTFWTSYKFERQWLESFERGPFAPQHL